MSLRPQRAVAQALSAVAGQLPHAKLTGQATVTGLTLASNEVQGGDLFVALPGQRAHGASHVGQALDLGAV
ncbi:MAG: Mur ligase domain-containing protein, partial [Micrococcales bacterium]|nr:Mur ligase domain-containing protein [Micrococcales bacterium]